MKIWTSQLLSQLKNCKNSFTVYDAALGYSFGYSMPEAEQTTASRVFPVELY